MNSDPATFLIDTWITIVRRKWLVRAVFFSYIAGVSILITPGLTLHAADATPILKTPNRTKTISYRRSASPSFVGAGVPVTSEIVSLIVIQKIAHQWRLAESANDAHSSGGSDPIAITFKICAATENSIIG